MSDIEKEIVEDIEESVEQTDAIEEGSEVLAPSVDKKVKKHLLAKQLVDEAKTMLESNEQDFNACKLLLENDLHEYTEAKKALHVGGLDDAKALLVELGFKSVSELEKEEENIIFEAKEETPLVPIKDVHSGKFTGFVLSLVAGSATFGALVYWATKKLDMTLDLTKIPDNTTIDTISNLFSNLVGAGDNPMLGMGLVSGVSLLSMVAVYVLRVHTKGNKNLALAHTQMEETQKYIAQKANCKTEMERVDTHISEAIATLKDYEVLLTEQNAKLKRISHFEGSQEKELGFSNHAKDEMMVTHNLIEAIQNFIVEPMSDKGKLSEETVRLLVQAKKEIENIVSKWG